MQKNLWIAHERTKDENQINLICFPYPGGSASYFAAWKNLIDEKINLLPVLYPGREVRRKESMPKDFKELILELVKANKEFFDEKYAIFGFCGGAIIGYEMAVKVKEEYGVEPIYAMFASSEAPKYLLTSIPKVTKDDSDESILQYLISQKMFGDEMLNNELFLKYYLPIFRTDCELLHSYTYKEKSKLNVDIDILIGKEDASISFNKAADWNEVTNGKMNIELIEGNHFFVSRNKNKICEVINKQLLQSR